ncbi:MAG: hypothetical protein ACK53L_24875, partial [Pirellulaceae bacterium]
ERAIIDGKATDVQEQRQVDAELLLEQIRDTSFFSQSAGADGPAQPLARLIREYREQLAQPMLLQ